MNRSSISLWALILGGSIASACSNDGDGGGSGPSIAVTEVSPGTTDFQLGTVGRLNIARALRIGGD